VNEDCLKLTGYFAERERTADGRFLGDALLAICERHGLVTTILMRGAEGFGRHQVLQTDRLLSLSDDLPMALVAVDARLRIEAALPEIGAAAEHGLLTLERARLLSGRIGPVALPEELHDASKLTVYCGRHERVGRRPAFVAIVELLRGHGLLSANVLLGVDGTAHGVRERARFFGANAQVPVMILAVGPGEQLRPVLPEVAALLNRPLLTLERVRICKVDGRTLATPHDVAGTDDGGLKTWVKLMVHADHDTLHEGRPLFFEIVRRLRAAGAGGATVLHGIWGFHGDREPQGDRLFSLRRHVPATTIVIDTPERIGAWFQIIDELTDRGGVVTSELVPAFHARGAWGEAGGLALADPTVLPAGNPAAKPPVQPGGG
jgi:PII-like signaling protein